MPQSPRLPLIFAAAAAALAAPAALAQDAAPTPVSTVEASGDAFADFGRYTDGSDLVPEYQPMRSFFSAYGGESGRRYGIAYEEMGDRGKNFLEAYITYLGGISPQVMTKDNQLAYWINLHNVLVIDAMSEVRRRRNIEDGRGGATPGPMWTAKRVTVNGVELSIDDIERRVIMAHWDNPNVLYGLYQGARGGPELQDAPFEGATITATLEEIGRDYVGSRAGLRTGRGGVRASALYDWYSQELFGGDDAQLLAHLASLSGGRTAGRLAEATTVSFQDFNYRGDEYVIRQQTPPGAFSGGGGGAPIGGGGGGSGS